MRTIILIVLVVTGFSLKAQTYLPGVLTTNGYRGIFSNDLHLADSSSKSKWSLNRYGTISSSFMMFKGGSASIVAAPIGLQLNRRLTNNLYAFAGLSAAPAYVNFNSTFSGNSFTKYNHNNPYSRTGSLGLYSRAELGLQYVNDEKTFSISGSIGIERNSYPMLPYNQQNSTRPRQVIGAQ